MATKTTTSKGRTVTRSTPETKTVTKESGSAPRAPRARKAVVPVGLRVQGRKNPPAPQPRASEEQGIPAATEAAGPETVTTPEAEVSQDVQAEAQEQAEEMVNGLTTQSREELESLRDQIRGKLDAVKGLPQYAQEEATYTAQLEALDARLSEVE